MFSNRRDYLGRGREFRLAIITIGLPKAVSSTITLPDSTVTASRLLSGQVHHSERYFVRSRITLGTMNQNRLWTLCDFRDLYRLLFTGRTVLEIFKLL